MGNATRFGLRQQITATLRRHALAAAISLAVAAPVAAQLLPPIQIPGPITRPLDRPFPDDLDPRDTVEDAVETVDEEVGEGAESVEDAVEGAVGEVVELAEAALDLFVAGEDPAGQRIEREAWVVLVPEEHAAQIPGWGFTIRERRDLDGLDLIMLRIDAPDDRGIRETELDLSSGAPGTVVDYNHVYDAGADEPRSDTATPDATTTGLGPHASAPATPPASAGLTIGVVDSSIIAEHEALRGVEIVQQDFVPFTGERPTGHGTAVASILAEGARGNGAGAVRLYAASVFVLDDDESIATTGSLVAALEWLGAQRVGVINMSLTGPPNRVLEAAIAALAKHDVLMVAAVGNEGPAGRPLYPAAYDTVVGITAVDSENRIYRHANRGPQVAFAAPGVRAKVARGNGGYGRETGTSMAAPFAAAIIARSLVVEAAPPAEVLVHLEQGAVDLGDAGFDEVYGFGLIAPIH
ncbi:MAG TPA: S8 family serine peptidase [Gammaproteobacteria bacterium]